MHCGRCLNDKFMFYFVDFIGGEEALMTPECGSDLIRAIALGRLPWWLSGKKIHLQCRSHRRPGFDPWARKIPWRRKWQPTPVFLPGDFCGQRSLVGYSPWGRKESATTEVT